MYDHFKTTYDIKYPGDLTDEEQLEIERKIWEEDFDKEAKIHKNYCFGILPDGAKVYMVNFEYKGLKGKYRPAQDYDELNPDTEAGVMDRTKNLALYISLKKEEDKKIDDRYDQFSKECAKRDNQKEERIKEIEA